MKKTCLFFLIFFVFLNYNLLCVNRYVSPSGSNITGDGTISNPWKTIQYAINNSSSGDIINVASGTYNEDILIDKGLEISGSGRDNTTINGTASTKPVISINSSNVKVTKFLIQNTKRSTSTNPTNKRYLIYIDASLGDISNITIEDNEIGPNHKLGYFDFDYTLQNMDAIFLDASSNDISDVYITNNFQWLVMGDGSGLKLYAPEPNEITNVTINDNMFCHNAKNGIEIQGNFNNSTIYGNSVFYQLYTRSGYQSMYGNGLVMFKVNGHTGNTHLHNIEIVFNSFYGNVHTGVYLFGKMSNIYFTGNDTWNNTDGMVFNVDANQWIHPYRPLPSDDSYDDDDVSNITVENDLFYYDRRFAMYNTSSTVIKAEKCYWEEPHPLVGGPLRDGPRYSWGPRVGFGSFTDGLYDYDGLHDGGRDYQMPISSPTKDTASLIYGKIDFSPYITDLYMTPKTLRNITVDNANVSMPAPPYALGIHNEFDNIQNAIDAAQEGDIIEVVGNGTGYDYAENITIDKGLTIKAKSGTPVLYPSSGTNITSTTSSNSAVIGFKIVTNAATNDMFGVAQSTGDVQTCGSTYWNGTTQLLTYSSIDPFVEDGDGTAPAANNNSTNDNNTLGLFIICTQPPQNNLVLWLDAAQISGKSNGDLLDLAPPATFSWEDLAGYNDHAKQGNNNMRPMYNTNVINSLPAVRFTNTGNPFTSKYLWIDYNSSSNRPNALTDKMLFVLFKTPSSVSGTTPQMVFELGGVTSGMNAYVRDNKVGLGIWRTSSPVQRRYFEFSCSPNTVYLARAYYDGTNFQAFLNGTSSSTISFAGLTADAFSSRAGVGASVTGTRCANGAFGQSQTLHFDGHIGEVLLYNDYDAIDWSDAKNYLGAKWGLSGYTFFPRNDGWELISEDSEISGVVQVMPAYPNPFTSSTSFDFVAAESQNVTIELYDALGQSFQTLYNGKVNKGEVYTINIDGTNLSSGLYVYRIFGDSFTEFGKVILIK